MRSLVWLLFPLSLLAACDQMKERAGFPDPARVESEGKAIGGACRNAGRGLEDCFHLNPEASKAAIYAGWKEMNEYMARNNLQAITPTIPVEPTVQPDHAVKKKKAKKADATEGETDADKKADVGKDAAH
jgi:hypothetical protein